MGAGFWRRVKGTAAWCGVALAMLLPAAWLGVAPEPHASPWALFPAQGLGGLQLWSAWSPAWVHASTPHWLGSIGGLALLIALGLVVRPPPRAALAWALAWPLTHLLLLLDPRLLWYVGASGVLHAGVAVLAGVLWQNSQRGLGATLWVSEFIKVSLDVGSGLPTAERAGLGVPMAPLAHALGAISGLLCWWLLAAAPRRH